MRIRFNSVNFIFISEVLFILYYCLPITLYILDSFWLSVIMVLASFLFLMGLILCNNLLLFLEFFVIYLCMLVFERFVWSNAYSTLAYSFFSFSVLAFIFGGVILCKSGNYRLISGLVVFFSIVFIVTGITSIIGLHYYPLATREMARGATYDSNLSFSKYIQIYRRMNIASWSQMYGMIFAIPCGIFVWKKTRKIRYLFIAIVVGVSVVFSQLTFAVLISLLMIFLLAICNNKRGLRTIVLTVIIVFLIIAFINRNAILSSAISISNDMGLSFLTTKLSDLNQLLVYGQVVGDADARVDLYMMSFKTFLEYPIFGAIFSKEDISSLIGQHSQLLDTIALMGILGLIGLIVLIIRYCRFIKATYSSYNKELYVIFAGVLVLSFLNPVINSPQIFAGAFLYSCLCAKMCELYDTSKNYHYSSIRTRVKQFEV